MFKLPNPKFRKKIIMTMQNLKITRILYVRIINIVI